MREKFNGKVREVDALPLHKRRQQWIYLKVIKKEEVKNEFEF